MDSIEKIFQTIRYSKKAISSNLSMRKVVKKLKKNIFIKIFLKET